MNILIAGGTGFLGSYLKKRFEENGDNVSIVSRNGNDVSWQLDDLIENLNHTDVLINLSGKSINCRFTDKNKEQILNSRIETTALLNQAVQKCENPPKLWINASATGIYKHTIDESLDEYSTEYTDDFLGEVVQKWEQEFYGTDIKHVRKVDLRTSVVLSKTGGVFPLLNRLSKLGAGGKQGNGRQMFSWIGIEDYFRIIQFIIQNREIESAVNASSPYPVSNAELMKALNKRNKALIAIPSPKFLLYMASYVLNFQPDLVLDSTNAVSKKLKDANFQFIAPDISSFLNE